MSLRASSTQKTARKRALITALCSLVVLAISAFLWHVGAESMADAGGWFGAGSGPRLLELDMDKLMAHPLMMAAETAEPELLAKVRSGEIKSLPGLLQSLVKARPKMVPKLKEFVENAGQTPEIRGQALHSLFLLDPDAGQSCATRYKHETGYLSYVAKGILEDDRRWAGHKMLLNSLFAGG